MMDRGDPKTALTFFEKMDKFPQSPNEKLQYGFTICFAYTKNGEFQKAKIRLNQLLAEQPNFKPGLIF